MACFTISFNLAAIIAVIPTISRELGFSDLAVSKILSYYYLPYGLAALIYAPLTRYFSYARIYFYSMVVYVISSVTCGVTTSLDFLCWARGLMAIAAAGIIPLGLMLIGEFFEKKVRGKLVGFFFGCAFIGSFAGMLTAGFFNWRWLFYVPAILGFLLAVICFFLRFGLLAKIHGVRINYWRSLTDVKVIQIFVFIFLISFLYHGVSTWYGIYLDRMYSLDKFHISGILTLTLIVSIFGQNFGGYLSDKHGRLWTTYLGVIGLGLSTMLLFGHYSLGILIMILLLISLFWTIGHNATSTILTDFSNEQRAVIASLNSSVRFVSAGLGFLASRVFIQQSFKLTFLVIGILIVLLSSIINYSLRES